MQGFRWLLLHVDAAASWRRHKLWLTHMLIVLEPWSLSVIKPVSCYPGDRHALHLNPGTRPVHHMGIPNLSAARLVSRRRSRRRKGAACLPARCYCEACPQVPGC